MQTAVTFICTTTLYESIAKNAKKWEKVEENVMFLFNLLTCTSYIAKKQNDQLSAPR